MRIRLFIIIFFIIGGFLLCASESQAGFGISPPFVKTKKPIFPGSHFEQKITLLRSDAEEELMARITVEAPDIAGWITVQQGLEFDLPAGKLQIPMIVEVNVPDGTPNGNYQGHLNIQIVPKNRNVGGGVAIALGARVDIDLEVTDVAFMDFVIKKISIPEFEKFKKPWNWKIFSYFFERLTAVMKIENTGNVPVAPTKVHIDVYDLGEKKLLESYDDESIDKTEPFSTKSVKAGFPTKLGVGEYWAKIRVYNDNKIIHNDKIIFAIKPAGSINNGRPVGVWPWVLMGSYIVFVLLVIAALVWMRSWRYLLKLLFVLLWPVRFLWRILRKLFNTLKIKFWQWMHQKSAEYQPSNNKLNYPHKSIESKNEIEEEIEE
ncbi:hypothetical protein KAR28_03910 [Candidatus Parcubacteria bacterium]|nr:hypothetical protein [Candidatus Parcubacteria bacterium]